MVNDLTSNQRRRTYAGRGHWNDPDMLESGNAGHDPSTGSYRTLAAPAQAGDTSSTSPASTGGFTAGRPLQIMETSGKRFETVNVASVGTAAGASTTLAAAASVGRYQPSTTNP